MTANADFLRAQTSLMTAELDAHGVPYVYRCYGDNAQKLQHVFHCNVRSPAAQACNAEECEFFKRFIKGKELPYESR